jgi:hypothetical protein
MVSAKQTIVVTCEPNEEHSLPRASIKFDVAATTKGRLVIEQGFVTLEDRAGPDLREYALPDTGIFIYFSGSMEEKNDKIVSLLVKEVDTDNDAEDGGHAELLEFLELTQDAEAIQAYRSLAFYWTSIQSGLGIVNGDIEFQVEEETDGDKESEDDDEEEDDGVDNDGFGDFQ